MAALRRSLVVLGLGIAGVVEVLAVVGDAARLLPVAGLVVPLLWRRSHPSLTAVLVTASFVVQLPWPAVRIFEQTFVGFICLLVASYSLGRHGAGRSPRIVAASVVIADGLVIGLTDRSIVSGLLAAGILGTPAWVGEVVRERVAARREFAEQAREIARSTEAMAQAQALAARADAAADIQDSVVSRVRAMLRATRRARDQLATDPAAAVTAIEEVERGGRETLADVRRALHLLRDSDPKPEPTPALGDQPARPRTRWSPEPWLTLGVIGFCLVEALVMAVEDGRPTALPVILLAGAMAAPLALRRRWPVGAALAAWAAACALVWQRDVTTSVVIVGVLLAGSAGAHAGPVRRVGALLVGFGGVVAVNLAGGYSGVGDYVVPFMLLTFAWFGGAMLRRQGMLLAEVESRAIEVRRLRDTVVATAAVQERLRLARDLHDLVAHHLMVMVVQAGAARRTLESGRVGAAGALSAIERAGADAVAELGSVLALVDRAAGETGPAHGMAELEKLIDRVRASGLNVELRVDGERASLPGGIDIVAYRIVQESLTNVIRHANAHRVQVQVSYRADRLTLEIVDDGRGLPPDGRPGMGITGMRERAELYGGECDVSSTTGGVRVRATLPLQASGALA